MKTLQAQLTEREATIRELNKKIEELEEELADIDEPENDFFLTSISATEQIEYRTSGNLADEMLMKSLGEALEHHTALEVTKLLDSLGKV